VCFVRVKRSHEATSLNHMLALGKARSVQLLKIVHFFKALAFLVLLLNHGEMCVRILRVKSGALSFQLAFLDNIMSHY